MSLLSSFPRDDGHRFDAPSASIAAGQMLTRIMLRARLPLALTIGLLGALIVWAALLPAPRVAPMPGDPDAVPFAWSRGTDRVPRLAWRTPMFAGLSETQARWSRLGPAGDETDDRLTMGDVGATDTFVALFATRAPSRNEASFYLAVVRAAAKLGLVAGKMPQPVWHEGRFGATETALTSLSPISRSANAREGCLAWRAAGDPDGPSLIGFVCPSSPQKLDAASLECLLASLSSADGTIRRQPEPSACRKEPPSPPGRTRTTVARTRQ